MRSVAFLFGSWLKQRWRAALGLALLLGLIGGITLTAAAGARRTATAYPRLLRWSNAANVQVIPGCVGLGGFYAALARLPQVTSMSTEVVYELAVPGGGGTPAGQLEAVASADGTLGRTTDQVRILAGRRPPPADPAAVMIDQQLAVRKRLRPGSTLHLLGVPSTAKVCPPGPASPAQGRPVPLSFRVSAVVAFDDQVVPAPGLGGAPRVLLSPGFWRTGAGRRFGPGDAANVRLRPGVSLVSFTAAARALARRYRSAGPLSFTNLAGQAAATEQAIRPEAISLAVFAALAAFLALVILGQLIGRQLILDSAEFPILGALGMTRARLAALFLARAGAVTGGGAGFAVAIAVAASPLMPIGPARLAEPSPGVEVNLAILGTGLAVIAIAPLVLLSPVAWRVAGRTHGPLGVAGPGRRLRGSRLAQALAVAGSVTGGIGVRMAFEPGRGRSAVPVRSSLAVTAVTLASLLAALVFGASLITLISTPHRYGQNWNQELDLQFAGVPAAMLSKVMAAQPTVRGYAGGDYGQLDIGGQAVPAIGIDPLHGRGFLTLLAGHPPSGPGQVVLGERTLRALHRHTGETVPVSINGTSRTMLITGVATLAQFSQATSAATDLGTGAAVAARVLSEPSPPLCAPGRTCYNFVLIRYRPGTGLGAAASRLQAIVTRDGCPPGICLVNADQRPGDIRDYAAVRDTPLALCAVLALLAVGTFTHVLVTSVRRRRRELAILKTLGLRRAQLLWVVGWEATALAAAAMLAGLPLGLLAGRWSWALFAGALGVAGGADVPVLLVLLTLPVTWLVAILIAAGPARAAARVMPAAVLRAE
jgi:ABC-type antimicrobial peptide transport system permease subunit